MTQTPSWLEDDRVIMIEGARPYFIKASTFAHYQELLDPENKSNWKEELEKAYKDFYED